MTDARVLVVDDEPDILSILVYQLSREGFRVSTAVNGQSAIATAVEERRGRVQTRRQLLQTAWQTNAQIEVSDGSTSWPPTEARRGSKVSWAEEPQCGSRFPIPESLTRFRTLNGSDAPGGPLHPRYTIDIRA